MELLELFLEEFNMWLQSSSITIGQVSCNIIQLDGSASFRQLSTLEPTSTQDKHSKVTLSEWNIGLLDGLNRLHQVPGLQLEYWWSCAQHKSKPQWSHMLECKQRMVNHQRGVVRVVPGGVQHVCSIAGGCRALASLWVKFHATTLSVTYMRPSDNYQHSNPQARTTSTPKSHFQSGI
ncbi:hypothetical protein DFH27DRAFT_617462 [Peziza echinospora]|nr:hypothetical protein DFH27DRAFT_617462 [Peziza echinospora]